MDSYIILEGLPLYLFCGLFLLIAICIIGVAHGYINEIRAHEDTKWELEDMRQALDDTTAELNKAKKKIRNLKFEMPEVE